MTPKPPTQALQRDDVEASEDMLFDFFDFFDRTVDDLFAYVLYRLGDETRAEETMIDLYFSLLQRRRFFWWRKVVQISTLLILADKKILSQEKQKSLKKEVFDESTLEQFLGSIEPVSLDESKKAALRTQLLEKYRAAQMSNIRFVPSVALAGAATGCFMIFSSVLMQPVSVQGASKQIAATQVLFMNQEREYRDTFYEAEKDLKSITAHFAEKDLAHITLDLAPRALQMQMDQEQEMGVILRSMSTKAILSSIESSVRLAMR